MLQIICYSITGSQTWGFISWKLEWTCRRCTLGVVTAECNNVGYRGTIVFVDLSAGILSIFYHPSLESTCVLELIFRIELVGLAWSVSVGLYYLFLCTAQWSINSPCHYTVQFILTRFIISLWYLTVLMFGRLNSPGYRYLRWLTSITAALLGNCSPIGFTVPVWLPNFKPLQIYLNTWSTVSYCYKSVS